METYISLVGIVIAFCTLIFLMMRGVNLFITVMIASLIAIVSGNMNIYKTLTEKLYDWLCRLLPFLLPGVFLRNLIGNNNGIVRSSHFHCQMGNWKI